MSTPPVFSSTDDEIDVGHEPRRPPHWNGWSSRRRLVVGAIAGTLAVAAAVTLLIVRPGVGRPSATSASTAPDVPIVTGAPGADVVLTIPPQTRRCPVGRSCTYSAHATDDFEVAFQRAFVSAGYISRQRITDAATGQLYWQVIAFTTGTLVTITLSQEALNPAEAVPSDVPTPSERDLTGGSLTLTAVRDDYLSTVTAAGLPGQPLPVRSTEEWLRAVPAP